MKLLHITIMVLCALLGLMFYLLFTRVFGHSATDLQLFIAIFGIIITLLFSQTYAIFKVSTRVSQLEVHHKYIRKDLSKLESKVNGIETKVNEIQTNVSEIQKNISLIKAKIGA